MCKIVHVIKPEHKRIFYSFLKANNALEQFKRNCRYRGNNIEWFTSSSSYYIEDLFSDGEILSTLDKMLKAFGETDEMFKVFKIYLDEKAKDLDSKYEKESEELDSYKEEYGEKFIQHLKFMMKRKHIRLDRIVKSMPDKELIKKDEEHLLEIAYRTRIYMGMCNPVSY